MNDDTLNGGDGNDSLNGGNGADRFVFSGSAGNDTVIGFTSGSDKIDLSAYGITSAQVSSSTSGSDTILAVDSDADGVADFEITLLGVGAPAEADYIFFGG